MTYHIKQDKRQTNETTNTIHNVWSEPLLRNYFGFSKVIHSKRYSLLGTRSSFTGLTSLTCLTCLKKATVYLVDCRKFCNLDNLPILVGLVLTHYSLVLLFYTPRKHQKIFRFSDVFRGYRKATLDCNGLNKRINLDLKSCQS